MRKEILKLHQKKKKRYILLSDLKYYVTLEKKIYFDIEYSLV